MWKLVIYSRRRIFIRITENPYLVDDILCMDEVSFFLTNDLFSGKINRPVWIIPQQNLRGIGLSIADSPLLGR